jgi:bifunctional non-homologous end joining protein LigD
MAKTPRDLKSQPGWIEPCVPKLVKVPPAGPDWSHEIKHDGYRAICSIDAGEVSIFTRRGHDWAQRMPAITAALRELESRAAVIDGEAVMIDAGGVSDFFALHAALARRSAPAAVLVAFDLMHLDGEDLRVEPMEKRRSRLARLLRGSAPALQFSEEIGGEGAAALAAAREFGLEGIVSKRRGTTYRSGKVDFWRKTKCTLSAEFAVIGFEAWGRSSLRSLRLARLVDGELVSCGSAGSGLSQATAREIRAALDAGKATVVDLEYRGFTPAGELRHPVIKGWQGEQ